MKLNARQVETAKPKDKPYKLADGGACISGFPNGTNWRMKYRIAGEEKRVVFGVYPTITLADARSKRDDAKKLLVNGLIRVRLRKKAN
jgi:hypothetical protein